MTNLAVSIELLDMPYLITRQLEVPAEIRLDHLHAVFQTVMGWHNTHLYAFQTDYAVYSVIDPDYPDDSLPADKACLADLLREAGPEGISYLYDFGDAWRHQISIGREVPAQPGLGYPRLVSGQGKCPPEDIGGTPGFEEYLKIISDLPAPAEYDELLDAYGTEFDCEAFDLARKQVLLADLIAAKFVDRYAWR